MSWSEIARFPGGPSDDKPPFVSRVDSRNGHSKSWEGGTSNATFSDGNTFEAKIGSWVNGGQYAGVEKVKSADFTCWGGWKENLYNSQRGERCSQVYYYDQKVANDRKMAALKSITTNNFVGI